MARSGSGVWSAPSGFPVVSGTTISSTDFNSLINDIGAEITASLPVAGTAPMTGALRASLGTVSAPGYTFSGDTDTGIYSTGANSISIGTGGTNAVTFSSAQVSTWTAKAIGKAFDVDAITSVASAATTDIGAAATSEVLITGTTTITSFGTSNAGIRRKGRFNGILTLTHNATSLIIPGGASITTAANDRFEALSLGSGNWIVTDYTPAAGLVTSIVAGTGISVSGATGAVTVTNSAALTLGTMVASTSGTSITFTSIPATVKRIIVSFSGVSTSGTSAPVLRIGAGSVSSSGYNSAVGALSAASTSTDTTGFLLARGANWTAASTIYGSVILTLMDAATGLWAANYNFGDTAGPNNFFGGGSKALAGTLDRVSITTLGGADTFDAGNINIMYE